MIDPDQYDGFATPEELNLTPEEVEELRTNKRYLTAETPQTESTTTNSRTSKCGSSCL
jgi:hypothetical protein